MIPIILLAAATIRLSYSLDIITESNEYLDKTLNCPTFESCNIFCNSPNAATRQTCKDLVVNCYSSACHIICQSDVIAGYTCEDMTIYRPNHDEYSIKCKGGLSCAGVTIDAPDNNNNFDFDCSYDSSSCQNIEMINCPENADCYIDCSADYACNGVKITCPLTPFAKCDIICDGEGACGNIIVNNTEIQGFTSDATIYCNSNNSCYNLQLPSSVNVINGFSTPIPSYHPLNINLTTNVSTTAPKANSTSVNIISSSVYIAMAFNYTMQNETNITSMLLYYINKVIPIVLNDTNVDISVIQISSMDGHMTIIEIVVHNAQSMKNMDVIDRYSMDETLLKKSAPISWIVFIDHALFLFGLFYFLFDLIFSVYPLYKNIMMYKLTYIALIGIPQCLYLIINVVYVDDTFV